VTAFRLLHISDPHFSIQPNQQHWYKIKDQTPWVSLSRFYNGQLKNFPTGYSAEVAEIAAKVIFSMRDQFDMLVLTGDIATTGQLECLDTAREFTHSTAKTHWLNAADNPTLQGAWLGKQFILMPGNHDRYQDKHGMPGGTKFDEVYRDEWPKPHKFVNHRGVTKDGERLACIAADFCLRKESDAGRVYKVNRWGRGKVYKDAVKRLVARTKLVRTKYDPIAVVWLIHFPPTNDPSTFERLNDADLVTVAAKENGIPLILSGHLHRNIVSRTQKDTPVLCAGSLTSVGDTGWLHFIDVDVVSGAIKSCSKTDFKYDENQKNFVKIPARRIF
jgi:3',5'-cyclic AMP phosphodiesterase CpdA